MLEEAQGMERSLLYGVTALGDLLQQSVVHTPLVSTPLRCSQDPPCDGGYHDVTMRFFREPCRQCAAHGVRVGGSPVSRGSLAVHLHAPIERAAVFVVVAGDRACLAEAQRVQARRGEAAPRSDRR